MSTTKTVVRVTTAIVIDNPDNEVPDFNKLSNAATVGFDLSNNEGDLTPDDSTQRVEGYSVTNISISAEPAVLNKVHEARMEERFPRASITDPRKFSELQAAALLDDVKDHIRHLPVVDIESLIGHLIRFAESNAIPDTRWKELQDYAATLRAELDENNPI